MESLLIATLLSTVTMTTAYLDEISIGVFVERQDGPLTEYLNRSMREIHAHDNSTVVPVFRVITSPPDQFQLSIQVCKLLSTFNPAVILSPTPCPTTDVIHQVARGYRVPVLQWLRCHGDGRLDGTDDELLVTRVNMSVSTLDVILEVVLNEHWKDIVILYDHTFGATQMATFLNLLCRHSITSALLEAGSLADISKNRHILRHHSNYVMFCSAENSISLLEEARLGHLDLLGPNYRWLIWAEDGLHLDEVAQRLQEGDNVAVIQPTISNTDAMQQDLVMDTVLSAVMESVDHLMSTGQWTEPTGNCTQQGRWDAGAVFAQSIEERLQYCNNCSHYEILTYGPGGRGSGSFHKAGDWSPEYSLQIPYWIFPQLHQGYNNRMFMVTSLPYPPFVVKYNNGSWSGICFELLNELAWIMNFSYTVVEPPDGKWGIRTEDGSNNGMLGLLERQEVDFGVGIFSITDDREKSMDFSSPFWVDSHIILMKKPNLAAAKLFLYLKPFSTIVWYLLITAVPVAGIIIWAVTWGAPIRPPVIPKESIYDLRLSIWQTFGALMQQGMVYISENHSSRLMIALWWCFTIVVIGMYNGNLIAFLTAPTVDTPVNSLEELANSDMKVAIWSDGALYSALSSAKEGLYESIYDKIRGDEDDYLVDTMVEALEMTLGSHSIAHITEKSFYDTMNAKNNSMAGKQCEFVRAEERFYPVMYAFPFQKNSPHTREFSTNILRILEAGLMTRWKNKWFSAANQCTGLERTGSQSKITLTEAQGAFYLLGIGLLSALGMILVERVLYLSCKRRCGFASIASPLSGSKTSSTIPHTGPAPRRCRSHDVTLNIPSQRDRTLAFVYDIPVRENTCSGITFRRTPADIPMTRVKSHSVCGPLAGVDFVPHGKRMNLGRYDHGGAVWTTGGDRSLRRRSSPRAVALTADINSQDVETGETNHV